ncbi:MAG: ribonuclease Y, partial [bacterium]|nr:ribonuclease Y [bacterium]
RERDQLHALERKLTEREDRVAQKLDALEQKALRLQERVAEVNAKEAVLNEERLRLQRELEEVASLTKQEAAARVLAVAEEASKGDIVRRVRKLESQGQEDLEKKAHLLLASVIQRYAAPHVAETSTTGVHLPNDEIKGRIIGKEGRNIRALEAATGCDIIVDETPSTIIVSGFNPLRREVAKRALERLVADGRIQPARIEEVVASVKKEIAEEIRAAGEEVCYDLGITDFPPSLVQLIGRLKYRTSYGQSILQHSWEAARIGTMLAEELKADVNVVKRAVLLHDVGKAVDHEVEGTHVEIGEEIMKKYGVPEVVRKAAAAHHEDYPYETIEAIIVQISDAISAARPGARRESYEEYVKRLSELEEVATSFEGVEKAYAIAAGREVRVFVEPKKVDDLQALRLAQGIAAKIETELKYPGVVKVNVIRETRAEATAR